MRLDSALFVALPRAQCRIIDDLIVKMCIYKGRTYMYMLGMSDHTIFDVFLLFILIIMLFLI